VCVFVCVCVCVCVCVPSFPSSRFLFLPVVFALLFAVLLFVVGVARGVRVTMGAGVGMVGRTEGGRFLLAALASGDIFSLIFA
jgi:uncharacterized membrane protein YqhA